MTQTTTDTLTYQARGTTDEITQCEICGKPELKGTVRLALVDPDGGVVDEVYAGVVCAARRAGRKAADIRTEAARADRAHDEAVREAFRAWDDAQSSWFCAERDAALGPDAGFAAIVEFSASPEHKAAAAAWLAANPLPGELPAGYDHLRAA
jgi:hypothetical protein